MTDEPKPNKPKPEYGWMAWHPQYGLNYDSLQREACVRIHDGERLVRVRIEIEIIDRIVPVGKCK